MAIFGKDAELKVPSRPDKKHAGKKPPSPAKAQSRAVGPYANIGRLIHVQGEISGAEDLYIAGRVEGRVNLPEHLVTVAEESRLAADVVAKNMLVIGQITGNVEAHECIEIEDTGVITGDLTAPRLIVHEGAQLRGAVTVVGGAAKQAANDASATGESGRKKPADAAGDSTDANGANDSATYRDRPGY